MTETIEVDDKFKRLISFAIRRVLKAEMLNRKMGTWNEFFKNYDFSDEEFEDIKKEINSLNFPSGYYDLCDLIGEKYDW